MKGFAAIEYNCLFFIETLRFEPDKAGEKAEPFFDRFCRHDAFVTVRYLRLLFETIAAGQIAVFGDEKISSRNIRSLDILPVIVQQAVVVPGGMNQESFLQETFRQDSIV